MEPSSGRIDDRRIILADKKGVTREKRQAKELKLKKEPLKDLGARGKSVKGGAGRGLSGACTGNCHTNACYTTAG